MQYDTHMEARVWSRVMGKGSENCPTESCHKEDGLTRMLREEMRQYRIFRCLSRLLPEQRKQLSCLQELAKRNITYLKALYFVENNSCFRQNSCEEIKICSPCDTLRELYRSMTEGIEKYGNAREEWAKNKRTQQKYILCILQSLL